MEGSFRPHQPGLRKLLGDLEAEVMEVVWAKPEGHRFTVRDVYETLLSGGRKVAYTTVMTVMGNLGKKHVLAVEKEGAAYLYHAPMTREQFTSQAVGSIVHELVNDFSNAALAHFAQALESRGNSNELLAGLKARIEQAKLEE